MSFREAAQKMFWQPLDAWQMDMCDRLGGVAESKGRRVLIHCSPQMGKTVILSQRFPAYMLARDPLMRIRLLMYNLTHARNKGGAVTRGIMESESFQKLFPDPRVRLPKFSRSEEWSTVARKMVGDGQASFKCFGLDTGATGEGGDCFPAGTLIRTDVGSVPIEMIHHLKVKPGVYGYDHEKNEVVLRHIEATREISASSLLKIRTESGRTIKCTPDHRVFVSGKDYLEAKMLVPGDVLVSAAAGNNAYLDQTYHDEVVSVRPVETDDVLVYDLQVADCHNFFANNILVHNCWLIDDPYPSAAQGLSKNYNDSVWSAWEDTIQPRLSPDANVVIMFHRYQISDLAGQLLVKEPGQWEMWRYPAIFDGDYKVEGTEQVFPAFPLGREIGTPLSGRFPMSWYEEKKLKPRTWEGQFQGRPTSKSGEQFKVERLRTEEGAIPLGLQKCRAWDLAATEGGGDYTVGILMGKDSSGFIWVLDMIRGQWGPEQRDNWIKLTAAKDGYETLISIPKEPSQAGKDQVERLTRMLSGFGVIQAPTSEKKELRADGFISQVNAGNVRVMLRDWFSVFVDELRDFPLGANDDICLVAGTLIQTIRGEVPIELIRPGDMAATRTGFRRVTWAGQTSPSAEVRQINLSNGRSLVGTPKHRVFVENKGFVLLDTLSDGDILWSWQDQKKSDTKASSSGGIQTQKLDRIGITSFLELLINSEDLIRCIEKSTRTTSAQFPKDGTSTTRMIIRSITSQVTWSLFLRNLIGLNTGNRGLLWHDLLNSKSTWGEYAHWRQNGIEASAGESGIGSMEQKPSRTVRSETLPAEIAARHSSQKCMVVQGQTGSDSAQMRVQPGRNGEKAGKRYSKFLKSAQHVITPFWESEGLKVARVHVLGTSCIDERGPVYNLTVEDDHEYFANGVLVHNCDAGGDALKGCEQGRELLWA